MNLVTFLGASGAWSVVWAVLILLFQPRIPGNLQEQDLDSPHGEQGILDKAKGVHVVAF